MAKAWWSRNLFFEQGPEPALYRHRARALSRRKNPRALAPPGALFSSPVAGVSTASRASPTAVNCEPSIRPLSPRDAPVAACVHAAAFPGYFLTRLGPRFLAALYRRLARDAQSAAFVAQVGEEVVAFAAAVLDRRRFTRSAGPALAAHAALRALTNPALAWQMASRLPRALRGTLLYSKTVIGPG